MGAGRRSVNVSTFLYDVHLFGFSLAFSGQSVTMSSRVVSLERASYRSGSLTTDENQIPDDPGVVPHSGSPHNKVWSNAMSVDKALVERLLKEEFGAQYRKLGAEKLPVVVAGAVNGKNATEIVAGTMAGEKNDLLPDIE